MLARADARRARRLRAAIVIQQNVRMLKARAQYQTVRKAALVIQSAWRGHVARTVAQDIRCKWALECFLLVLNVWVCCLLHHSSCGEKLPTWRILMISCRYSALSLMFSPSILTYQCHLPAEARACVVQQAYRVHAPLCVPLHTTFILPSPPPPPPPPHPHPTPLGLGQKVACLGNSSKLCCHTAVLSTDLFLSIHLQKVIQHRMACIIWTPTCALCSYATRYQRQHRRTNDCGDVLCTGSSGRHCASSATGGGTRPARPSCCTAAGLCACSVPGAPSWPAASCARGVPLNEKLASCCRSVPLTLHVK